MSEEEEFGIRKCNEEVKGWTSSTNQQEYPPERTKTKEDNRLKRKIRKINKQP